MPVRFNTMQREAAFDAYFAMGAERHLNKLRTYLANTKHFTAGVPAYITLREWSSKDNWQARITQRDIENGKKIQAKTDRAVVNTKADYRRDVRLALQPLKAAINKVIVKNEETGLPEVKIPIIEARDLTSVIMSFEKLIKLDLILMGEADSRTEHNVSLIDVLRAGRDDGS